MQVVRSTSLYKPMFAVVTLPDTISQDVNVDVISPPSASEDCNEENNEISAQVNCSEFAY